MDGMVMRSVYLRPKEDSKLRQLAHDNHVSKSDLIRSAISAKLLEWLAEGGADAIAADLALGRRDTGGNAQRASAPVSAAAFAPILEEEARAAKAPKPEPAEKPKTRKTKAK